MYVCTILFSPLLVSPLLGSPCLSSRLVSLLPYLRPLLSTPLPFFCFFSSSSSSASSPPVLSSMESVVQKQHKLREWRPGHAVIHRVTNKNTTTCYNTPRTPEKAAALRRKQRYDAFASAEKLALFKHEWNQNYFCKRHTTHREPLEGCQFQRRGAVSEKVADFNRKRTQTTTPSL